MRFLGIRSTFSLHGVSFQQNEDSLKIGLPIVMRTYLYMICFTMQTSVLSLSFLELGESTDRNTCNKCINRSV